MKKSEPTPEKLDLSESEGEELIQRLNESNLSEKDRRLLSHIVRLYFWLIFRLQESKLSLKRLKEMVFGQAGKNNRSPKKKKDQDTESTDGTPASDIGSDPNHDDHRPQDDDSPKGCQDDVPPKPKHPGRLQPKDYPGATTESCSHETLSPGDTCPRCGTAPLKPKTPHVSVRIEGNPLFTAKIESIERLACEGCGEIFYAKPPQAKYSEQAKAVLAYYHYGMGLPLHRIEHSQARLGIPFPDATQWDQIAQLKPVVAAVFHALESMAAQSELIYQDDTSVRIQSLTKENQDLGEKDRKGMFTTALVCVGTHEIVLYYSGRQHAGENLDQLLQKRDPSLPPVIQMCDALSANKILKILTILCHCLSHGVRKFKEIVDVFPQETERVLRDLKQVYKNDQVTKQRQLSHEARLQYHQKHSQPIMEALKVFIDDQLNKGELEPGGSLTKACQYLQNHWHEMTQFLRVAGAPLDNNVVERVLKKMIRHRKNSYFFKSTGSAELSSRIVSLIATAEQAGINAIDYLTQLQIHQTAVLEHPERWLPWCYQDNLRAESLAA